MKALVTGSTGFVGSSVVRALIAEEFKVVAAVRQLPTSNFIADESICWREVGAIDDCTQWIELLRGVDTVVHCAARAHVMRERAVDALLLYGRVNVAGTLNLAQQAAFAGVKRFVFLSSIKVNGESTDVGKPFTDACAPAPEDAYGISKAEAEAGLRRLSLETGMEVVIIRPPLVYGPGVKGNFASLLRWVAGGFPLPLGLVTTNRRSLVSLDNLVDLILICVDHPRAANQTFLVSDGEDLSTADLLHRLGKSLNRSARLIPVPVSMLIIALRLLGKRSIAKRLVGSLQVDISKTCTLLNWKPPVSVDEGLRRTAQRRL